MTIPSTTTKSTRGLARIGAFPRLRKWLHRLVESAPPRPDYYGEMLRQHPGIDPETLMRIR